MTQEPPAETESEPPPPRRGKKKLLLIAAPLALVAIGAGLWFGGVLPPLLRPKKTVVAAVAAGPVAPVFADLPDLIANLDTTPHHDSFIKLKVKLELARAADQAAVTANMPRLLDLFQTYLREMRPEEMRGAAGSYRLREELIARADIALAPVAVSDVLFTEMLIQ